MKSLTVREFIGANNDLDPLNIDIAEIKALSDSIPANGQIDINIAEILATKYLRGADLAADLMAIATLRVQKLETLKKKAYSIAALVKSQDAGIKTDKSRLLYADADDDYIDACNKHSEAVVFLKWITSKHDSFIRAHYNCKKFLDRGYSGENAASWNGRGEIEDKPTEDDLGDNEKPAW